MRDAQRSAGELLVELEEKGVTFEVVGEKLKYRDCNGSFSTDEKEKVKTYKNEMLAILKKNRMLEEIRSEKEANVTKYPLTDVQGAYLIGKTEAVEWGGVGCKGYIEVNFGIHSVEELSNAWEQLVDRHEMLRARVEETGFEILAKKDMDYEIEVIDLQEMTEEERTATLSGLRKKFSEYTFDPGNPPLFQVAITKREEGIFFHLLVDLIVSDFASVQLMVSEMGNILEGIPLKKVKTGFHDYALLKRQHKGSLKWYRDRAYWLERLADFPEEPLLPRDGRAADTKGNPQEFYRFQRRVGKAAWERIKEIAGEYGVTASAALIGVYAEVIARWSSNKRFTINLPIQDRYGESEDIHSIVGDFTAVNLLAVDMTQNMGFAERVKQITGQLLNDLEHNLFSGVEVLRELGKVSEKKEVFMPVIFTGVLKAKNEAGTIEYGFSHTPQVWIDCQVVDETDVAGPGKGLMISWDARKGIIKESIIAEMFEAFVGTIELLGEKTGNEWEQKLEVVLPDENKKMFSCEQVKADEKNQKIQQGVIEYARKRREKTAVIDVTGKVTYEELLENAERIAGYLCKEFGESKRRLVAVRMQKSAKQIATTLGVLIAGFSYVPIDIKQPAARQEKILARVKTAVELDEKAVDEILKDPSYRLETYPEYQNPIAYVIFTSGSTGEPKGVEMSHAAAQNTLTAIKSMYDITEKDTVLGIAELSFDLSVFDIFGVLGAGGTLVLPDPQKGPDAFHWGSLLKDYGVTLWNTVPAQAEMLDAFAAKTEQYGSVRLVLLSGDRINPGLPGRLRNIMPHAKIISLGGATEGGIWSIYHEISQAEETPSVLYGRALPGQWVGVLDEKWNICPDYAAGQIAIGGGSLAEGYLGDKELTGEKFQNIGKNRIYLTGDRGRYVENGEIEFLGRLDSQVKINGYRIEIAEIEAAVRDIPQVEDCCVVYQKKEGKGRLTAFVKDGNTESAIILKQTKVQKKELSAEVILEFQELLEEAICGTVCEKISEVLADETAIDEPAVRSLMKVQPQYEDLLGRWLAILVQKGYFKENEGKYERTTKEIKSRECWDRIRNAPYRAIAPEVVSEYIKMHAEHICGLFGGTVNPLTFLFPEGRTEIAESLYGETAIAQFLNEMIAGIVKEYAKKFGKIRILEVGGGIGATTRQVLGKTGSLNCEYHFTDVSNFFLNNLKKQYAGVHVELLNLDEFETTDPEKFQVIIAAGVLNNTRNISYTVEKLGSMLSETGILLITEPVEEHMEITVSQAFMMPEHSDERGVTGHCFFNEDEWQKIFDTAGLELACAFPEKNDSYSEFKQKLFVVKRKQTDYREYLKTVLPAAMIPERFISIENLPLSPNGKVDRKALLKIAESSIVEKDTVPVKKEEKESGSDLEKRIRAIMVSVSGNCDISYENDLLKNGFDSLILSQAAGKIVNEIPQADGLRFDEVLRVALSSPTIREISGYLENKEHDRILEEQEEQQFDQRLYLLGREDGAAIDLIKKLAGLGIAGKQVACRDLKDEVRSDKNKKAPYVVIFEDEISPILSELSELSAQGIAIKKVFFVNPQNAGANDLYLGDAVIIQGTQAAVSSWKEAILGDVKIYDAGTGDIAGIIRKEMDDGKE